MLLFMRNNILKIKSYGFALNVVKAYKIIVYEKKEFVLSKQFLKSGTAAGGLIREAEYAQSRADFISKLTIALKETNETDYWISLMRDTDLLDNQFANQLESENKELIRMLIASINTAKASK
jgi:four helix bundle protein